MVAVWCPFSSGHQVSVVSGLFAKFLRHFTSIINLTVFNNCKSRGGIEGTIGKTYSDDGT